MSVTPSSQHSPNAEKPTISLKASLRLLTRRRQWTRWTRPVGAAVVSAGIYLVWLRLWDLLYLSLVAFALRKQGLAEMNDLFLGHRLVIVGGASLLYYFLLRSINPFTSISRSPLIPRASLEKHFIPGVAQGAFTSLLLITLFIAFGIYKWVGWVTPYDQTLSLLIGVLIRGLGLLCLAVADEWFWRRQIFLPLFQRLCVDHLTSIGRTGIFFLAVFVTTILAVGSKYALFSIGSAQTLTLSMTSLVFTLHFVNDTTELRSSGYWFGLTVLLQLLLGQPLYGHDFSGIFLIKYQANDLGIAAELLDRQSLAIRWLSGGAQGLVASLALVGLLGLETVQIFRRRRKTLDRSLAGLLELR